MLRKSFATTPERSSAAPPHSKKKGDVNWVWFLFHVGGLEHLSEQKFTFSTLVMCTLVLNCKNPCWICIWIGYVSKWSNTLKVIEFFVCSIIKKWTGVGLFQWMFKSWCNGGASHYPECQDRMSSEMYWDRTSTITSVAWWGVLFHKKPRATPSHGT